MTAPWHPVLVRVWASLGRVWASFSSAQAACLVAGPPQCYNHCVLARDTRSHTLPSVPSPSLPLITLLDGPAGLFPIRMFQSAGLTLHKDNSHFFVFWPNWDSLKLEAKLGRVSLSTLVTHSMSSDVLRSDRAWLSLRRLRVQSAGHVHGWDPGASVFPELSTCCCLRRGRPCLSNVSSFPGLTPWPWRWCEGQALQCLVWARSAC